MDGISRRLGYIHGKCILQWRKKGATIPHRKHAKHETEYMVMALWTNTMIENMTFLTPHLGASNQPLGDLVRSVYDKQAAARAEPLELPEDLLACEVA
jgi:hypothetical protein